MQDKKDQVEKFCKLQKDLQIFEECVNFLILVVKQLQSHQTFDISHRQPKNVK